MEIWIESVNIEKMGSEKGVVAGEVKLVVFTNNLENSDYAEHPE